MFKKRKGLELLENGFAYNGEFYKYQTVKNIFFTIINTVQKVNFRKQGEALSSHFRITLDSGKKVNIDIDEATIIYTLNRDRKNEIRNLTEAYQVISTKTYLIRKKKYLSELETYNFFTIDGCQFYPKDRKVVFRQKDFYRDSYSFLKSQGYVEIRKKDYKALDKIRRGLSIRKIPQFNTQTDTDIIFDLLSEHMRMSWKK